MKICLVLHKYAVPLNDPCPWPLGYMYISAMLKLMGHEVKVLNYNLWDYDFEKEIEGQDRVCFTGFEEFFQSIIRDSAICQYRGIRTIVGGALATFLPLEMARHVDTVVTGEAESVLEEALNTVGVVLGKRPDLSTLPYPDYEGFGVREYHKRNGQVYMGILTSRGCPFHCTFCAQTCRFQYRKLKDVFQEIDFYREKYDCSRFVFNDNTINVDKSRFLALCHGMKERGTWGAAIRADVWDEEMCEAAKECGCGYVVVGVESFNQKRLNKLRKRVRVEQIMRTLDLLIQYGIKYAGNVLVGFEDETYEDCYREVMAIPRKYASIFPVLVQPFIGTKNAQTRKLTEEEYRLLWEAFSLHIKEKGKYLYPELPAGGVQ